MNREMFKKQMKKHPPKTPLLRQQELQHQLQPKLPPQLRRQLLLNPELELVRLGLVQMQKPLQLIQMHQLQHPE